MMAQPAQGPNWIRASTARPRFGARTRMFEAGFGRSQGWRRPKCRLRRSVRPVGRDEGTREAGGLPREKTFGDFWSFKSHSPSRAAAAKPLRGQRPGLFRLKAKPSACPPDRWAKEVSSPHPSPLPQGERGSERRSPGLKRCRRKRHKQKPQPKGCGFFIGSTCCQQQANRP